jgi:SAM-dependent methyltransferase
MIQSFIPITVRQALRSLRRGLRKNIPWLMDVPPIGFAGLRRWRSTKPIRRNFGWDTGAQCVDRYYIERFLELHSEDVRGRVLEIGDNSYTLRYGGARITKSDVLHAKAGNPQATLIGDLSSGEGIPNGVFDCVILTQTLPFVYDIRGLVKTLGRILAPGGVVLATSGGIAQIARYDSDQWGDFWRLTSMSAKRLFGEVFSPEDIEVESYGNVAVAIALLHGLVAEELRPEELDFRDRDYEVTITVRALKSA